jgi:phosphatidylserine/phosphatidylglycerophosphate/cardiolipin synthase-like enzyme
MAYSFTADPIGSVMRVSAADGLTVAGVMDADQIKSNLGTEFDPFSKAELDVYKDGIPGLMHHKVIIIDKSIVIFGSYNFTNSAETRNDETLVVIYNRDIAAQFMEEFQIVFKAAQ